MLLQTFANIFLGRAFCDYSISLVALISARTPNGPESRYLVQGRCQRRRRRRNARRNHSCGIIVVPLCNLRTTRYQLNFLLLQMLMSYRIPQMLLQTFSDIFLSRALRDDSGFLVALISSRAPNGPELWHRFQQYSEAKVQTTETQSMSWKGQTSHGMLTSNLILFSIAHASILISPLDELLPPPSHSSRPHTRCSHFTIFLKTLLHNCKTVCVCVCECPAPKHHRQKNLSQLLIVLIKTAIHFTSMVQGRRTSLCHMQPC